MVTHTVVDNIGLAHTIVILDKYDNNGIVIVIVVVVVIVIVIFPLYLPSVPLFPVLPCLPSDQQCLPDLPVLGSLVFLGDLELLLFP